MVQTWISLSFLEEAPPTQGGFWSLVKQTEAPPVRIGFDCMWSLRQYAFSQLTVECSGGRPSWLNFYCSIRSF
ncbi:MAG: hypothetical protein AAF921_12355 [Cyanobacteria bacterium P01_D01_bin.44]